MLPDHPIPFVQNCGELLVKRDDYRTAQVWRDAGVCGRCWGGFQGLLAPVVIIEE
ncbi:hypothetical protein CHISP_3293 [Chitinispirillum alkaliphilum]|nr:hypothetical protein CHISP_3293 [Chitinispirillum alkaliphilum]